MCRFSNERYGALMRGGAFTGMPFDTSSGVNSERHTMKHIVWQNSCPLQLNLRNCTVAGVVMRLVHGVRMSSKIFSWKRRW